MLIYIDFVLLFLVHGEWTVLKEIAKIIQRTLIITSSLGPEKFACYNKTFLYQDTKTIQYRKKLKLGTAKITLL